MAKFSSKKRGSINVKLMKVVVEKLQKKLLIGKKWREEAGGDHHSSSSSSSSSYEVPEDVKEGHFAVIAEDIGEMEAKRFVVPLSCLTHPSFLRLLEEAAEEYGFDQEGALTIPCRPKEIERILEGEGYCITQSDDDDDDDVVCWNSSRKTMVQSY